MIEIHLLLASGRLRSCADDLCHSTRLACERVEAQLQLADLDIVLRDDMSRFIPEWGIGGFTPDAHTLQINIDAAWVDYTMLHDRLPYTLAHELHHAARWRGPGYGLTLFEAIVTEGLADHFACELLDQLPPPWTMALGENEVAAVKTTAEADLDAATHDHRAWFFGTQPNRIPRWAGYSLGWQVVQRQVEWDRSRSAAQLVAEPATAFRDVWHEM